MPKGGSVNHTLSSDFTTTSLGELSRLFSKRSIRTVTVPSYSVRVTRRLSCSQVTSRPWRSRVLPLEWFDGLRKTEAAPVSSSQRMIPLLGMSLQSTHRPPTPSRLTQQQGAHHDAGRRQECDSSVSGECSGSGAHRVAPAHQRDPVAGAGTRR